MDREKKKPATEGAGAAEAAAAPAAPTSAPAATAPATPAGAAPASAPAARVAPASAAPASATPVAAAPAATAPAPATSASAPATAPAPATASAPAAGTVPAAASGPAVASGSGATAQKSKPAPKPTPARGGAKTANTSAKTWRDRGYISGNFGWQASAATFSDTRTLTLATGDTEPRHLTANYDVKAGPAFDIGAGVRFWKSLGIAGSVTRYSISNDIAINGDVPHPFFFNRPRAVSGTTPGTREELAIHLDAVWVVPVNKLQVAIFGGPTFFNAKQTVVSDFTYSESYPFDDATFTAGTSAEESKSVTGFNAGVDVGYFFNDVFGIGGVVRFSRGTLKSSIGDLDVGGPEFGGGIRIRLRQSTAPKSPRVPPAKPAPAPAPKKK